MKTAREWAKDRVECDWVTEDGAAEWIRRVQSDAIFAAFDKAIELSRARCENLSSQIDHWRNQGDESAAASIELASGAFKKFCDRLIEASVDMRMEIEGAEKA